jgi:hypothetical protein
VDISVYAFENKDGESVTDWTTQDYEEAKGYAMENSCRLIERIFTYSDSELLEDYCKDESEAEEDEEEAPLPDNRL